MSAIWRQTRDGGWSVAAPAGFPDEKTLQELVASTPGLLPLSGSPTLAVIGREVRLGTGYADVVAIEASGRPVVIEVKLATNAEARRAVVAQVLAYAAVLYGQTPDDLETTLGRCLSDAGFGSLAEAARAAAQTPFDDARFIEMLAESLRTGAIRIVLVLDDAPTELVRLAGFLEATTSSLLIELITVTHYELDGTRILVPQRVDPESYVAEHTPKTPAPPGGDDAQDSWVRNGDAFSEAMERLPADQKPAVRRLYDWAAQLEAAGIAELSTYFGRNGAVTLLPYAPPDQAGLVTIWSHNQKAFLSVWRSVFERRAPQSISAIEAELSPVPLGKGNYVYDVTDTLLDLLHAAYREAAG